MVRRFFHIFNKEIKGLHEAAYLLAIFAFLSQLLALFRDRILASTFGTSHILDIYYSAFRIPDFIFVTVGSMISISVLVPFIIEKTKVSDDNARDFIRSIFIFFSILIVFSSVVVFFLIPYIAPYIFKCLGSYN